MDRIKYLRTLISEWDYSPTAEEREKLLLVLNTIAFQLEQLTTVELTQTAPTMEELSVVEESIPLGTLLSSQSAPVDTRIGHAEPYSVLGGWKLRQLDHDQDSHNLPRVITLECVAGPRTGQLESFVRIAAQDVPLALSTSVKQPLKESVENSAEEYVKSQSKESNDKSNWLGHYAPA